MNTLQKSVLLFVCLSTASLCYGQDSESQRWVLQLQSPFPAMREQAQNKLIESGPESGAVLPDASDPNLPADVKRRIERIRKAWDERSGLAFLQPSAVESNPTQSLESWLQTVSEKTGNPVDFKRLNSEILSAPVGELKSTSFWQALDELALQNRLKYSWFERPKAVRLQPGGTGSASPVVYQGPFRVEVQEIGTTIRPADPSTNAVRAGLILAWEPRLRPIYIDIEPKIIYSDGSSKTGESIQILGGEGMAKPMDFIFPLTSPNGKKPAALSGLFSVVIAGESKTFSFPLAETSESKPASARQDQAVVVLKSVRQSDDQSVSAQLAVEFDESYNGLRSYMTWLNNNKAYAVDANGVRYESTNWETVWQSDRGAEAKYYFTVPQNAKIKRIEYCSPTAIRRVDYSFTFEEIFSEIF